MKEKKLTDEEIVKALKNASTGYGAGIVGNLWDLTLDLIDRQKAEIERLTEERKTANMHDLMYWFNAYKECVDDCEKYVIEASDNKSECIRLQKQVDALERDLENWKKAAYGYKHAEYQAVKDTAKEIFTNIKESFVFSFKGSEDYKKGFCDALEQYDKQLRDLAKQNGVEVE